MYSYIRSAQDGFKLRFLKLSCFRKAQVQMMEVSLRATSQPELSAQQVFTTEGNEREGDESAVRPSMRPSSF